MPLVARLKAWAARIKADVMTLWFCVRHPDTPLIAKLLAMALTAYAFSPIDLIPDFIPVLGLLDEAILLPLGIMLCIRLVPGPVLESCRLQAREWIAARTARPRSYMAAAFIVGLWLLALWVCWRLWG